MKYMAIMLAAVVAFFIFPEQSKAGGCFAEQMALESAEAAVASATTSAAYSSAVAAQSEANRALIICMNNHEMK
ncbi:hypothetical protein L2750_00470 [Shewanella submarina]|uniref:Uncharacterized protein n=1 Tax=Shewanella submarina TaxID=2016376 RepID=A0ABV7GKJ9_9GAMM|nr:hypothetical protein [Shewanella submarina]MCL1035632.1 hypothetical protein [Shewanella submarina]